MCLFLIENFNLSADANSVIFPIIQTGNMCNKKPMSTLNGHDVYNDIMTMACTRLGCDC